MKHLLYAYRVLLTGIHLMQMGEVLANLVVLNEMHCISVIDNLIARKRAGAEKMLITERELAEDSAVLDRLGDVLRRAHP